jgi:hypothetical protein
MKRKFWFLVPIIGVAAAALIGGAVMWLWNAILPQVVGVQPIDFWQALGLFVLCRILFGGFKGGGGGRHGQRMRWRRERWMNMSAEERAQMREQWQARCKR